MIGWRAPAKPPENINPALPREVIIMKGFFKDRFNILGISFVLFGIVVVFQLVNLQIIHGEEYDNISQRKLFRQNVIPAQRGNILDRYGVPIAVSRVGYTAEMIRAKMTVDERNEMILKLVGIFEKNGDKYVNSLSNYLTVNPFEYGQLIKGSEKAIKKWKEEMAIKEKDIQLMATPKDIFDYMRYKKFEIDEKYSEEDAYKIMCIRYEMLMRGCTATSSITLAKDIKVETVAEIEERHMDSPV
jgi:penicillin-binding protein 2